MAMTKKEKAEMETLRRQRDEAVRCLNEWRDSQTPAAFSTTDIICDTQPPRFVKRYFHGRSIEAEHLGIRVSVKLREDCISVDYTEGDDSFHKVTFTPVGYQQFELSQQKGGTP